MKYMPSLLALVSFVSMPVEAAAAQYGGADTQMGAFVGARFQVSLGARAASKTRAALAIAPTRSSISRAGTIHTNIGEGLALNLAPKSNLTVTLAGVRADTAFVSQRGRQLDARKKLGVSTGGWVAIGVGVAVLAGGIYFAYLVHEAAQNSD